MDSLRFPHPLKTLLRSLPAFLCMAGTVCLTVPATASPVGDASAQRPLWTAADHFAKAKEALGTASAFRQDAARYRQELQKEKMGIAILPKAPENPWWRKARQHYEPLIAEAESRAAEADRLAEYHRFRAEEIQGR